jgi:peptidoglycan hydrolase-like protein with peptidoglycan-binding domain
MSSRRFRSLALFAPLLISLLGAPLAGVGARVASADGCTVSVVLKPYAVNAAVPCLERRLADLGYTVGSPDTFYDATSVKAVKTYQLTRGLYDDGIVTSIVARQLGLRGSLPDGPGVSKVTVIGDSTSAAMRWYDEANNTTTAYDVMGSHHDLAWSIESCRRLVALSCRGRKDPGTGLQWSPVSVLPLMRGSLKGRLGQALVIMAGYDDADISAAIDPIVNEARQQGVSRVFWLNYRIGPGAYPYKQYYLAHNRQLEGAGPRLPNLVVLDWNGYANAQPTATQTAWFASDGIHLTKDGAAALAAFIDSAVDSSDVASCLASAATTGTPDPTAGEPADPAVASAGFVGDQPVRVLDTRNGSTGRVGAGRTVTVDLASVLPAGATSAALQVTAVTPCASGFLTVFACGVRPSTANVNYVSGRTTSGLALSLLTDRSVCVHSSAATHLTVDVVGAFTAEGELFHPNPGGPVRWVDTRGEPAMVALAGPLVDGGDATVQVAGLGDVPSDATAVWLNVAAVSRSGPVQMVVYPGACGTSPVATSVSSHTGRAAAAAVLAPLRDGKVCIRSNGGAAHAVVDLSGWFGGPTTGGLAYRALAPTRVVDTRPNSIVAAGGTATVPVSTTTVVNVAAVGSTGFGYASAKPCGSTALTALLNTVPGETVSNLGAVGPGDAGAMCVSPSVTTHLAIDVTGRFEPAT